MGVSGCFGSMTNDPDPIDDIEEVAVAVDEIENTDTPQSDTPSQAPSLALAQLVEQYARRVRLLTWAVIAIVVVLVIREVEK